MRRGMVYIVVFWVYFAFSVYITILFHSFPLFYSLHLFTISKKSSLTSSYLEGSRRIAEG